MAQAPIIFGRNCQCRIMPAASVEKVEVQVCANSFVLNIRLKDSIYHLAIDSPHLNTHKYIYYFCNMMTMVSFILYTENMGVLSARLQHCYMFMMSTVDLSGLVRTCKPHTAFQYTAQPLKVRWCKGRLCHDSLDVFPID